MSVDRVGRRKQLYEKYKYILKRTLGKIQT